MSLLSLPEGMAKIPILVGPTGVGKSEIAYHLALKMGAEILSADAFQVYRGFPIGTAQPPRAWQEKVKHHLVGIRGPELSWSAVEFAQEAMTILKDRWAAGKKVIIIGGAGFYMKALVDGIPTGLAPTPEKRNEIFQKVTAMGNEKAHQWLNDIDSNAAQRIHPNDRQRICRALEKASLSQSRMEYEVLGKLNVIFLGLERSRENLDNLLIKRVSMMWQEGLLEEARKLGNMGLPPEHPIWGAIGYSEALAFLQGAVPKEEAMEKVFRRTRQYAKRQWTWFRHQHQVEWFDLDNFPHSAELIDILENKITSVEGS